MEKQTINTFVMTKMSILANISSPSGKTIAVRVTPAAERAIRDGHPWLFADSIRKQSHDGKAGDLAVIFDRKGRFLAIGLYDPTSPIRVRILQQGQPTTINQSWFASRLGDAARLRAPIQTTHTNGYRLVHGENDRLPGLIVDRYDDTLVLKLYTLAWVPYLNSFLEALLAHSKAKRIVLRLSRLIQDSTKAAFNLADGDVLIGPSLNDAVGFLENGLSFEADVIHGQKTGFFLDQRDNRMRVENLAAGRTVLNVFAYTGAFSLYAARGGANQIVSLDLSRPALAAANRNFQRNQAVKAIRTTKHERLQGDAFALLKRLAAQGSRFDMVILDPPAFARRQSEVARALEAYYRLTTLGLRVLQRDGILVSASCSSKVPLEDFFRVVQKAVADENRPLFEIERTGHPIDHPIGFREGAYLKCLFGRVA